MLILIGVIILAIVVFYYLKYTKCKKCGKRVMIKYSDSTPSGPNDLNISCKEIRYSCSFCGTRHNHPA
jgi:hypothetical protein